jgi:hypothetical protein
MGIERVRYRRSVYPGDTVIIEAHVQRLRSRMGVLKGVARVNDQVVAEGTMTFALGEPAPGPGGYASTARASAGDGAVVPRRPCVLDRLPDLVDLRVEVVGRREMNAPPSSARSATRTRGSVVRDDGARSPTARPEAVDYLRFVAHDDRAEGDVPDPVPPRSVACRRVW